MQQPCFSLSYCSQYDCISEQITLAQRVPANKFLMYSLRDKAVCCSSQRFERVFKFDYRIGIISVLAKKNNQQFIGNTQLCHYAIWLWILKCFQCIKTKLLSICAPFHNQTDHVCPFRYLVFFCWPINCSRKC